MLFSRARSPWLLLTVLVSTTAGSEALALEAGCGFLLRDGRSCWREEVSGPESRPRCANADLSADPWVVSFQLTGRDERSFPSWQVPEVAEAGNRRYGWGSSRPPGYWPLGGPVNEPWAESLSSFEDNLRWACSNYVDLPESLQDRMGGPEEFDLVFHQRELYDLIFLGGGHDLNERIKAFRFGIGGGGEEDPLCEPNSRTLCLAGGRFRVQGTWARPSGEVGGGRASALSGDTGVFWFFSPANVELVVKVLDGCSSNGHFWVFAGGLTNVEVELIVEDTETGAIRTYQNPQGVPFQPLQDTEAFATCP
ncbi:MAG: hypothetical protein K0U98_16220 [Deltaproteobacteria bacterium]|nr:hypothetical protein [Deltaproteobacteria bacterium]